MTKERRQAIFNRFRRQSVRSLRKTLAATLRTMRLLFRAARAVARFAVVEPTISAKRPSSPLVVTSRRLGWALADGLLIAVPTLLIVTSLF